MGIEDRARTALNLDQYSGINSPEKLGYLDLDTPENRQYILRMLVREPFGGFKVPDELLWLKPLIEAASNHQEQMGIRQPYCHITVRHGEVTSEKDDEWHVDGFSMNVTHLPEQNYAWVNRYPTEYLERSFDIPGDFDPQKHNIHLLLQDLLGGDENVKTFDEETAYCFDPYVLHRRPQVPTGIERTFVRVSFCPMEIEDVNNTQNPLLPRDYDRDGVEEFRNQLERYSV